MPVAGACGVGELTGVPSDSPLTARRFGASLGAVHLPALAGMRAKNTEEQDVSDERQTDELRQGQQAESDAPELDQSEEGDVEGHMMSRAAPELARLRGADIERDNRQRQREKDVRVNRPQGR